MPDKPIDKWTLADVKQYCRARVGCDDCKFLKVKLCGMSRNFPSHWNLHQKYSDEVIEFAKHIKAVISSDLRCKISYNLISQCVTVTLIQPTGKEHIVMKLYPVNSPMASFAELDGVYLDDILAEDD